MEYLIHGVLLLGLLVVGIAAMRLHGGGYWQPK